MGAAAWPRAAACTRTAACTACRCNSPPRSNGAAGSAAGPERMAAKPSNGLQAASSLWPAAAAAEAAAPGRGCGTLEAASRGRHRSRVIAACCCTASRAATCVAACARCATASCSATASCATAACCAPRSCGLLRLALALGPLLRLPLECSPPPVCEPSDGTRSCRRGVCGDRACNRCGDWRSSRHRRRRRGLRQRCGLRLALARCPFGRSPSADFEGLGATRHAQSLAPNIFGEGSHLGPLLETELPTGPSGHNWP